MFRFVLPAVHAACFVLLAVHRLSYGVYCAIRLALPVCATRRAVSVFSMGLPAILPRRIYEFLQRTEFRRDFATCKIRRGADSPCMRLAKFSGGALLEILSL